MKRSAVVVALVAIALAIVGEAFAAGEEPVVYFRMPDGLFQKACAKKVWSGVTAKFAGAKDVREAREIGIQVKGDSEIRVYSNPSVDVLMTDALGDLFEECGMNLVAKVPEGGTVIEAEVREFFVGVEKGTVTGRSEAQSLITFNIKKGGQITSVDVGMEVDAKGVRKKKIKAVSDAANRLLAETLKAIPENRYMKEIK
ncbi:MAG: hypothetical protein JXA24_03740 [Proteobacteria bacterium]|nr:hypothetical protein [Pseudomonadota bacterium]